MIATPHAVRPQQRPCLPVLFALQFFLTGTVLHAQPASQPEEWRSAGIGGGGALFACSINPSRPDQLFIACDMSELYRSTDFGASWTTLDFRQINGGNRTGHIRFTRNADLLYTISVRVDNTIPVRSTDGGTTWRPLETDPTGAGAFSLHCDPIDGQTVLVTDYSRLFVSRDGGATFLEKFSDASGAGLYIAGALFDGGTIYLGTNHGVLVSTDGGSSFAIDERFAGIPDEERMVSFTGAMENGTVRFYCVTLGAGDVYPGVTGTDYDTYRNVYAAESDGSGWRSVSEGIPSGVYPFFVDMGSTRINTAYIAGGSDNGAPVVYRTTDGGASWTDVFRTENNENIRTGWSGDGGDRGWSFGEYALGFSVCRSDPDRAIITDLGFAHVTSDGGSTWSQVYVHPEDRNTPGEKIQQGKSYRGVGLENTAVWHLAWIDAETMIAGYTDIRGTRSTDGGASWGHVFGNRNFNTAYHTVRHPSTGTLYTATSSVHDLYQSTYLTDGRIDNGRGGVIYSTDNGATWETLHDFGHPVIWLALDSANPNRMYASVVHSGEGGIYVTEDLASGNDATWRGLAAPPRTEGHPFNIHALRDGTLLCTYSGRRGGSPLNFTASSGIFLSADRGATWQDRSSPEMLYWTKDVTIDPHDPDQNTWYAGVWSGYGGAANNKGGLYRTTDRGATWRVVLELPSRDANTDRVTSCAISPTNPDEMYVTTETDGLWFTSALRSRNPEFEPVAAYPFRQPERVFYNPFDPGEIWVTSFGNGMRVGTIPGTTGVERSDTSTPRIMNLY